MTLTLELVCNVTRGTDNIPANFGVSVIILSSYGQTRHTDVPLYAIMGVIVFHPYTKIEVRRPPRSEDMAHFPS